MRYSQEAADVIVSAAARARALGHSCVGTAHLFIALSGTGGMTGHLLRGRGAEPELSIFVHENHWMGIPKELYRYTLRRDGFVSLHAGAEEETVVTKPFIYNGSKLYANIESSAWGYLYFTLILPDGSRIESAEVFGA